MRKHLTIGLSIAGILLAAIMFTSCGATYTASGTNVSKIDELALIEPHSIIFYYDNPKTGYSEASLTSASEELLTELITSTNYPFTDPVPADYGGEGAPIAKWIETFVDLESSDIKNLRVPQALTELIKSTNHRYGIVVHAHGFIQSNEAYDKAKMAELVGNVIRTIFDEPKRYTAGDQVGNALYTAVIDTQTNRVVYFNSVLSNADHPLSRRDVNNQLKSLLKKFH